MKAIVRASKEKNKACLKAVEACPEDMGANQEKSEARMEASQEKVEATAEHCKWVLCIKAMQVLTTVQGQAYNVFHGALKGAMYEETTGATKDRFEDHLAVAYCSQAKHGPKTMVIPCRNGHRHWTVGLSCLSCTAWELHSWGTRQGIR